MEKYNDSLAAISHQGFLILILTSAKRSVGNAL